MVEEPALGPRRIAEAPVVRRRRGDRLGRRLLAPQALRALLPEPDGALPPAHLGVDQRRRVGGEAPRHGEERTAQVERVGTGRSRRLAFQEAGGDALALRRDGGEPVGHVGFRRACGGRVFGHVSGPVGVPRAARERPRWRLSGIAYMLPCETNRSQCRRLPALARHAGTCPMDQPDASRSTGDDPQAGADRAAGATRARSDRSGTPRRRLRDGHQASSPTSATCSSRPRTSARQRRAR